MVLGSTVTTAIEFVDYPEGGFCAELELGPLVEGVTEEVDRGPELTD